MRGRQPLPPELEAAVARVLAVADLSLTARREVEEELRAHFEDGLAAGVGPAELLRRFGDPEGAGRRIGRSRSRGRGTEGDANGRWRMGWSELAGETRRAVRRLLRAPAFSLLVVATLALGIGANTAVFTVLDAVLLAPLPYEEPGELVRVHEASERGGRNYLRGIAVPEYAAWDDVFESFGVLYTYDETGADLTDGDRPERVVVSPVDAAFFRTMGVPPLLGRTFHDEETVGTGEEIGRGPATPVVVVSYDLWQRRFGGDRNVLGRTLRMDGGVFEVVGVMPAGFTNPIGGSPDLWVPHDMRAGDRNSWGNHYLSGVARLRDGLTIDAARQRVDALVRGLVEAEPEAAGWQMELVPLREDLVDEGQRAMLWVLAAAVALVLLSACVNVGNLVFARSLGRGHELAVRSALGSGRSRLVGHLLAECGVLALAGGLAGVAVGWLTLQGLLALAPDALPPLVMPELSTRVFLIALAATSAALLLFGLAPAVRASRTAPAHAFRAGGRGGTADRRLQGLRNGLVAAQVAVAVVLVVGAGLLVKSFSALRAVDLAVETQDVLTFEVHLPDGRYGDGAERRVFHERLHDRLEAIAGVEAAGAISWLPVNGRFNIWGIAPEPDRRDDDDSWRDTEIRVVAGSYFHAMGIDPLRGEEPGEVEPDGPRVIWVNQALVDEVFGGEDVVGRTVYVALEERRIAGVVEDVPHTPRGATGPKTYIPHAQFADNRNWALYQAVRTRPGTDPAMTRQAIRAELAALDPLLVLHRPRPFQDLLAAARAEDRFATSLMTAFALLALGLSAVGTYGVLSNTVAGRRREIGIRMALGADAGRVRRHVAGSTVVMTALGAAVGVAVAWVSGRWLEGQLFEVEPGDPLVFAGGVLAVGVLAALATWVPARRATTTDPARTLSTD